MFDAIPVLEAIGADKNSDRIIRTLGYVEQLSDGTLKATVHCDIVSDTRRVYSASVCADCTAYPTQTLESLLAELLDTVDKHVEQLFWYTPRGDCKADMPCISNSIVLALHKYNVTQ